MAKSVAAPKARWFHFSQNNSGGKFEYDPKRGITHHMVIEAPNYQEANMRAQNIGLYFDGCDSGMDCECCGDRWYRLHETTKGDEKPSVYGKPVTARGSKKEIVKWIKKGDWNIFVHPLEGEFKGYARS